MSLQAQVERLTSRLKLLVSRGRVRLTSFAGGRQRIQVELLRGELRSDVHHWQPTGFASRPLEGAEALCLSIGASRSGAIAICVEDPRHRIPLEPGESALYDHFGRFVRLRADGTVEISAGGTILLNPAGKVVVNGDLEVSGTSKLTGNVTAEANVEAIGNVTAVGNVTDLALAGGLSMLAMRQAYNSHVHTPGGVVPLMQ